jgi:hypothetical protein
MMRNSLTAWVLAAVILLGVPGFSHHSASNFDEEKQVTIQGTVTQFKLTNPHPIVYFQAQDETGKMADWFAESGSPPSRWYNAGRRANFLKPGETVTIVGNPSKDGRKALRILKIVNQRAEEWIDADTVR